jgi:hypothetical protein
VSHYAHWVLITVALVLNWGDRKAICLTLIVGLSLLIPVASFTWRSNFYLVCGLFEILWALCAIRINTRASAFVAVMCAMLFSFHMIGWDVGGHPPNSPYRVLVKIAEYAEILACIIFANPIVRLLKNDARNR